MGGVFSASNSNTNGKNAKTKKVPPPPISDVDRAMLDVKNARDRLTKYQLKLEKESEQLTEQARLAKAQGKTKVALYLLQLKKIKTRELESTQAQLLNVFQLVQTMDSTQNTQHVLKSMKQGQQALQKLHEQTTVEDVLELMDQIREEHDVETEICNLLQEIPNHLLSVEEEADVEAELLALVGGDTATTTTTTATTTPTTPLPEVPTDTPLPQVPTTKLPEQTELTELSSSPAKVAVAS